MEKDMYIKTAFPIHEKGDIYMKYRPTGSRPRSCGSHPR